MLEQREAAFDAWLHQMGYTYTGESTLYALTVPEMMRLHQGWEYRERQKNEGQPMADAQAGGMDISEHNTNEWLGNAPDVSGMPGSTKARAKAANPHRQQGGANTVRQSDLDMLKDIDRSGGDT